MPSDSKYRRYYENYFTRGIPLPEFIMKGSIDDTKKARKRIDKIMALEKNPAEDDLQCLIRLCENQHQELIDLTFMMTNVFQFFPEVKELLC